ncbi:MAG: hypothetical protein OXE87_04815 [Chloroflexi bacterium]|nr:hypothetical protein [Chloroflexota bacterium]
MGFGVLVGVPVGIANIALGFYLYVVTDWDLGGGDMMELAVPYTAAIFATSAVVVLLMVGISRFKSARGND